MFGFLALGACIFGLLILGAVEAVIAFGFTVKETPSAAQVPFGASGSTTVTSNALNVSKTLNANSAAGTNVTLVGYGTVTMSGGAGTINLAALGGFGGSSVNLTGAKVRAIIFRGGLANANPIKVKFGASNPYTGLGDDFAVSLIAGKEAMFEPDATAVASGVRLLDVEGTGTQTLDYIVVAGTN